MRPAVARRGLEWFVIAPSSRIAGLCHSVVRGEPYNTCSLACSYCYARWYRGPHGEPRPIHAVLDLVRGLARASQALPGAVPVRVATLSDPFQPAEARYRVTLRLLRLAARLRVPVVLNTRLPPPGPEWWDAIEELAGMGLLLLQVTVTGHDEDWGLLSRLEPGSPPPGERLAFAGEAADRGVPVAVRVQPLIPGLGDVDPRGMAREAARAGARLLIIEFLRVEREALPHYARLLGGRSPVYSVEWEDYAPLNIETGIVHPPLDYRLRVAREYSEAAAAAGLAFQTCKEGLFHLHHPQGVDCCGFALLGTATVRRPHLGDLYRLAVERGSAAPGDLWGHCQSSPGLLCRGDLERLPKWLRRPLQAHERRLERILSRPRLVEALAPSLRYDEEKGAYTPRHRPLRA